MSRPCRLSLYWPFSITWNFQLLQWKLPQSLTLVQQFLLQKKKRRFTTTGIGSRITPAGYQQAETHHTICSDFKYRIVSVSAILHLKRISFWSLVYLNIQGSLLSTSSFIYTFVIKSFGRGLSYISPCQYSAKDSLRMMIRMILLYARMKAFRLTFPKYSLSLYSHSTYILVYILT